MILEVHFRGARKASDPPNVLKDEGGRKYTFFHLFGVFLKKSIFGKTGVAKKDAFGGPKAHPAVALLMWFCKTHVFSLFFLTFSAQCEKS